MRKVVLSALLLLVAVVACGAYAIPPDPPRLETVIKRFDAMTFMLRIDPPAEYVQWTEEIEQCSGIHAPYDDTFWLVARKVLRTQMIKGTEYQVWAEHIQFPHEIIVSMGFPMNANVMRHELLHHALSFIRDTIDHDPLYYGQKCRAFVQ